LAERTLYGPRRETKVPRAFVGDRNRTGKTGTIQIRRRTVDGGGRLPRAVRGEGKRSKSGAAGGIEGGKLNFPRRGKEYPTRTGGGPEPYKKKALGVSQRP